MRIMIISDLFDTAGDFAHCMQMMGHVADVYIDLSEATRLAMQGDHDLVVLIDHDEFEADKFMRAFREGGYDDPVLLIMRDDQEDTRIAAFEAGADQVCNFSADCDEWAPRVRTLLRHCKPQVADTLTYGQIKMDLAKHMVTRGNHILDLKGKPYSLLEFFMRNPEVVHSRERIAKSVWDQNFDLFSNVIEVTVSKLRAQIDRDFEPPYLHTISGHGYCLDRNPRGG